MGEKRIAAIQAVKDYRKRNAESRKRIVKSTVCRSDDEKSAPAAVLR